ncbi:MAG TPA: M48 family metalloprotease [Nitrosospira sp.]|nr:M48 family metalloprotease [Nitrosospira sp.]
MKFCLGIAVLSVLITGSVLAAELPDLGDASRATISLRQERELGLRIMSEIRANPNYLDDAEVAGYLTNLGNRLILGSREAHPDQEFEFFAVQDDAINAFALPGGFMGFNTGLIITAQSESELAGVMAHEIAHVTQKHLARMISGQKYSMLSSLAGAALAILASRTNPQMGQAVLIASQARQIQSQLDFTREHEKEADRIGFNILVSAGLDPHGMSAFFERLQRAGRFHENGAPSYLRTHPITYERIADIESRTQGMSYRQVPDSLDFQLVRAKLRASLDSPGDAVERFDSVLRDKRYTNEAVERYGLINALLRDRNYSRAEKELAQLYENLESDRLDDKLQNHDLGKTIRIARNTGPTSPMIDTLAARVKLATGQVGEAIEIYQAALQIYPQHRALIYDYADALIRNGRPDTAVNFVDRQLQYTPNDTRLFRLQARGHEALGDTMAQHRSQAEVYTRQGNYPAAIEQLQIALKAGDGDFYKMSSIEARLKELRIMDADHKKDK